MGIYQSNQNLKKQTAIYRIENCHQDTCDFQNDWSSATHNVLAAPPGRCLLIRDQKRRPFPQDQWHDCTFPIGPSFHIDISVGSTFSILTYIWLIFFNGKCRSILPSWTPLIRHGRKSGRENSCFGGKVEGRAMMTIQDMVYQGQNTISWTMLFPYFYVLPFYPPIIGLAPTLMFSNLVVIRCRSWKCIKYRNPCLDAPGS